VPVLVVVLVAAVAFMDKDLWATLDNAVAFLRQRLAPARLRQRLPLLPLSSSQDIVLRLPGSVTRVFLPLRLVSLLVPLRSLRLVSLLVVRYLGNRSIRVPVLLVALVAAVEQQVWATGDMVAS
jgi:hypothetical protein